MFFLNDTATTEIYTYCHTLSLHDALPILLPKARFGYRMGNGEILDHMVFDGLTSTFDGLHMIQQASAVSREGRRSEEHTSELQSLMRISYAVFCLKNKKNTQYTTKTTFYTLLDELYHIYT